MLYLIDLYKFLTKIILASRFRIGSLLLVSTFMSCNANISCVSGLGDELAKNIVLASVKSVTLHDEQIVLYDLSKNFIFLVDDIGKNQTFTWAQKRQDLNNVVLVSAWGELSAPKYLNFEIFSLLILDWIWLFNMINSITQTNNQLLLVKIKFRVFFIVYFVTLVQNSLSSRH